MKSVHAPLGVKLPRGHMPGRSFGFMTPLPLRHRTASHEPWHGHVAWPPLQNAAVLILWLLVVLAMIWLFAELWMR
jgi:hypothetical protein